MDNSPLTSSTYFRSFLFLLRCDPASQIKIRLFYNAHDSVSIESLEPVFSILWKVLQRWNMFV